MPAAAREPLQLQTASDDARATILRRHSGHAPNSAQRFDTVFHPRGETRPHRSEQYGDMEVPDGNL